ncbi:MAG: hypothetical protein K2X44_00830, partial [Magnetospirillum sp.]|nr:hypothetical protein [Magnetospirillum sp.]
RSLTARLGASMTVCEGLRIGLDGTYGSDDGILSMDWLGVPFSATPLSSLSSLISVEQVTENVPAELPTGGAFVLGQLNFVYDTKRSYLVSMDIGLQSQVDWTIIEGLLSFNSFAMEMHLSKTDAKAETVTTGSVRAPITLAGATFLLAADKPTGAAPWVLSGSLENVIDIDFSVLLSELLGTSVQLPSGYGFPTALHVTAAEARLTPATKAFAFMGNAFIDWSISFGGASLAVLSLEGKVDFPGGELPRTGSVGGTFSFGTVLGAANVALGSGDTPLVVTAAISNAPRRLPAADLLLGGGGVEPYRRHLSGPRRVWSP